MFENPLEQVNKFNSYLAKQTEEEKQRKLKQQAYNAQQKQALSPTFSKKMVDASDWQQYESAGIRPLTAKEKMNINVPYSKSKKFPTLTKQDENFIMQQAGGDSVKATDVYKLFMESKSARDFINAREWQRNELAYKASQEKDPETKSRYELIIKGSQLADIARRERLKEGFNDVSKVNDEQILTNLLQTPEAQEGFTKYINNQISLDDMAEIIDPWYTTRNKPVVEDQSYRWSGSRYDYVAWQWQEGGEWNDNLFWRMTPTDEATSVWWILKEFWSNTIKSAVNLWSDIGNMFANPRDTWKALTKWAVWGVMNLIWADDRAENKWWRLSEANETADLIGWAIKNRYWSWEAFSDTAYNDPVWVFSDVMSVISGGAWLSKTAAKTAAKWATLSNMAKWANALNKAWDIAGNISRATNLADPATMIMNAWWKTVLKTAKWVVKTASKLDLWSKAQQIITWLDPTVKNGIKNNPYVSEYWKIAKKTIDEEPKSVLNQLDTQSITQPLYKEVGASLLKKFETAREFFSESGPLYQKIREVNPSVDITPAIYDMPNILTKHNIKVNPDWTLDFWYSAITKAEDITAITKLVERLESWKITDAVTVLNLRKVSDTLSKWDSGTTSEWMKVVRDIRKSVDKVAKEQVPSLKELDDLYRNRLDYINEAEEWLVYRDWSRRWEIRDNFYQIIKTIGGENRAKMASRLSEIAPDLLERVEAIKLIASISKAYANPPRVWKTAMAMAWWAFGYVKWWIPSMIWFAIAGYFWDQIIAGISKANLNKIASKMSPEAVNKLESINTKLSDGVMLNKSDKALLNSLREKIVSYWEKREITKAKYNKMMAEWDINNALPSPETVTPSNLWTQKNPIKAWYIWETKYAATDFTDMEKIKFDVTDAPEKWYKTKLGDITQVTHNWWAYPTYRVKVEWSDKWFTKADIGDVYKPKEAPKMPREETTAPKPKEPWINVARWGKKEYYLDIIKEVYWLDINKLEPADLQKVMEAMNSRTPEKIENIMNWLVNKYKPSPKGKAPAGAKTAPSTKTVEKALPIIEDSLIAEARKYKTAEEFIKKQANLYHWTDKDFIQFSKDYRWSNTWKTPANMWGVYFTNNKWQAESFWKKIHQVYLDIKNPKIIDAKWKSYSEMKDKINDLVEKANKSKHDWIIIKNYKDAWLYSEDYIEADTYIVFDENQIKTESQLKQIREQANKKSKLK